MKKLSWKVYKTQLVRENSESNAFRFEGRFSDNCSLDLNGYEKLYKLLLNRSANAPLPKGTPLQRARVAQTINSDTNLGAPWFWRAGGSCQLIHAAITAGTSRVAAGPLCLHAVANTPTGLMELVRSYRSISFGLPSI